MNLFCKYIERTFRGRHGAYHKRCTQEWRGSAGTIGLDMRKALDDGWDPTPGHVRCPAHNGHIPKYVSVF